MISLDTNVLVRLLVADDAEQTGQARLLVESQAVWLAKSVLLETEWVLRYSYELDRQTINRALRAVLGLEQVHVESPDALALALAWHTQGMDFADALHLASSDPASSFATFDRALIRQASGLEDTIPVRQP